MRHIQPKQYLAATQRAIANADSIEWEELPSFAGSLTQRLVHRAPRGANDSAFLPSASGPAAWDNTLPAALDPALVSQPFREPLEGLATREVIEPDVFRHFFGAGKGV
ncbi:MAG: hypothetical protein M3O01_08135 [Pseudomonadota bacterium]|nr:hypothetical protein [Pseudomonadota bacterium]